MLAKVVAPFIAAQVDNLRSNISKCALMLVKEFFMRGADTPEPDARMSHFCRLVIPVTLIKTVYEKQFIAIEAKKACEFCAKGGA